MSQEIFWWTKFDGECNTINRRARIGNEDTTRNRGNLEARDNNDDENDNDRNRYRTLTSSRIMNIPSLSRLDNDDGDNGDGDDNIHNNDHGSNNYRENNMSSYSNMNINRHIHDIPTNPEPISHPAPRYGHSAVLMDDGQIVIFGGWRKRDNQSFQDIWMLNTHTLEWHPIPINGDLRPQPRGGHSAVLISTSNVSSSTTRSTAPEINDGLMYIFGGQNALAILGDLFIFDTTQQYWYQPNTAKGSPPCPRSQHCCFTYQDGVYVLFGHDGFGRMFDDMHRFDVEDETWQSVTTTGSRPPAIGASSASTVVLDRDDGESFLVMFGGRRYSYYYVNETFLLNLDQMTWYKIETEGIKPTPRAAHTTSWIGGDEVMVFGGSNGKRRFNDVYILDLGTGEWRTADVYGDNIDVHSVHSATVVDDRVYVFGGFNGRDCFAESYILKIEEPIRLK
eukprot:gb/GECH01009743.1/.p1 GENE.gb/GECH01009743.1/~~gb/GECH01009743.1/.p1  ORF type:complete len:450 (+),score=88.27 gb/GECH01009743.1/:1-1350(+)